VNSVIGACIEAVYLTLCIRLARKAGSEKVGFSNTRERKDPG